jgi:thiosulfate dehydrogenase
MKAFHVFLALIFIGFLYVVSIYLGELAKQDTSENKVEIVKQPETETNTATDNFWVAPDWSTLASNPKADLIKYGKELIVNTSLFLGPKGSVAQISNGMNCQNCHLDAGTKVWGNNYSAVYSTYPKFRERSGAIETIAKRVNDCFERSLNGKALDTTSKEMNAIITYITWLGTDVNKGDKPKGSGITEIAFLDRAASPEKGELVYEGKCSSCHQSNGEGVLNAQKTAYQFPPLWGKNSYNEGAGLYRLSRFAGYVKSNMPLGANHNNPQLTDEEAWDVAAFVNSMPRPKKDLTGDWPNIAGKPIDHPFGPYADKYNAKQHKYGPFKPIKADKQKSKKQS